MPEMNRLAEEYSDRQGKVLLLQNAGFLVGFGVIFVLHQFEDQIRLWTLYILPDISSVAVAYTATVDVDVGMGYVEQV